MPTRSRRPRALFACAALAAALACARGGDPGAVAREFWEAVVARDFEAARAVSTAPDSARLEALLAGRPLSGATLATVLRDERSALVETVLARGDGRGPLAFHTHLILEDDGWRVDAEASARALRAAALAAAVDDAGAALREGQRALAEAVERGADEAAEALRRALEDLQRSTGEARPPAGAP